MRFLQTLGLVGFLGLMHLAAVPTVQADAITQPRFTLTDLGPATDGQANPYYSPPTGYTINGTPDPDINNHPGRRIGWTFTKVGSTENLLPGFITNDANSSGFELWGYSSSGVLFGSDYGARNSFFYDTNTKEFGSFKDSGTLTLGISGINSMGQAVGTNTLIFSDNTGLYQSTFYSSFLSDPVVLKDLLVTDSGDWVLLGGAGINDNGQIFGTMFNTTTRESEYFRLDPVPVPEPSTFFIMAAGTLLALTRYKMLRQF